MRKIISDHAEAISALGTTKNQILKKVQYYTPYGSISRKIEDAYPKLIMVGNLIDNVARTFSDNECITGFSAVYDIVVNFGLASLKTFANNKDIQLATQFIIKLMRYCRDDFSMRPNIFIDTSVETLITAFPIPRKKAIIEYSYKNISNLKELPKVYFDNESCMNIGYTLFYIYKANGKDVEDDKRGSEALNLLGIKKGDYLDFEDSYQEDALDKTVTIQCIKNLFGDLEWENYGIDEKYRKRVLRKLANYMPNDIINKAGFNNPSDLYEELLVNTNTDVGINIASAVLKTVIDGMKDSANKDNIHENFIKELAKKQGYQFKKYGEKIIQGVEDYTTNINS